MVWAMARARGNFDRQNQQGMERNQGATPRETLSRLREVAPRRTGPPAPVDSRLVEEVVHGEDIRRPLGIWHDYAAESIERALRYQARVSEGLGGGRQRAERVTLHADDMELSIGDGPQVHGPALALLLVISGRSAALADLEGPGLSLLS